jgi:metallo-beta-lactamase class B
MRLPIAALLFVPVLAGNPPDWSKPAAPFHIAGPVYSVGTAGLGCYLITGTEGDILINTGLPDSPPLITAALGKLGVAPQAIRVLLINQAHFDHASGFAGMQKITGAKIWSTAADAPLLETGGAADPGGLGRFTPVQVDRVLRDGETIALGEIQLKVIATPGHSPGSVSYLLTFRDGGKDRTLLFANLPTVVMPLVNPKYPAIAADLRLSLARLKALHPDLWVAAHVSQCDLAAKAKTGRFEDAAGYAQAVAECAADFEAKAAKELGPGQGDLK